MAMTPPNAGKSFLHRHGIEYGVYVATACVVATLAAMAIFTLRARGIHAGFGFLWDTAGFDISFGLIPYDATKTYARAFLVGLLNTLAVSAVAIALATCLGLGLAIAHLSEDRPLRVLATAATEIVRNTPLLLQILIFYFIVAKVLGIDRWWAGVLTLALYEGAFAAEIIRGAIVAVSRGQWEAGASLALTRIDTYRYVVLPQALPLMLPPLTGVLVNLVKHSSIVSVIAIFDLTNEGRSIAADTFMSFEVWLAVAALYLVVTVSLSLAALGLERRMSRRTSI